MDFNAFDAINTPLHKGVNLIEASAGTGKTYTIAMLVLRLVVESGIPIDKILVVTFTKAATEELKARIRNRLADAKRILAGDDSISDATISTWLDQIDIPPETVKQRLASALLDIDQAGIFTIHGFCQRILKEHALSSGQLFDAELTEDLSAIKQSCADDFWRRQIQNRCPWEVAVLTKDFIAPDQLLDSIAFVPEDALIYPDNKNLADVLTELRQSVEFAKDTLTDNRAKIETYFEGPHFKASYQADFLANIDVLTAWLNGNTLQTPTNAALALFTSNGVLEGLNGTQFKSNKSQQSDERKAEFIATLEIYTQPSDDLAVKLQEISVILRRNLLEILRSELDKQLEQLNVWSFDNLITHLAKALHSERAGFLIDELRQRFHAALIDEFQDTDNNQWHIFSTLFAADSHYLFLVGDPKQAIYKFRGADIYSYLEAQTQAQQRFTLGKNWRSHPQLVAAVNRLFQREEAFLLPDITFHATRPALSENNGTLIHHSESCPPMMLWQLPESGSKSGYWQPNRGDAAQTIRTAVVNEIVELLSGDYQLEFKSESSIRHVKPQDIAILVRTNQQAKDYQDALRLASVPSVLNSTESVFATEEALQLYKLLQAVAHPGDTKLLGQALALTWFGYDGQALFQTLNNESELDSILSRFTGYYQLWQNESVMAMMQSLLKQEKILHVLSQSVRAERRITNLQHVLEVLQQAVIDQRLGLHKALNCLKTEITIAHENKGSSEAQQLRLESDADAVKIITMHRAKGLEYPIVFCPYLWQFNHRGYGKNPLVKCHYSDENGRSYRLVVDLGSEQLEHHQTQASFEERAEDIRLAYVALTRAKYRCYVAWANVRTEEKPNESALARLLNLSELNFAEQQQRLQQLQTENGNAFSYKQLELNAEIDGSYHQPDTTNKLSALKRRRSLYTDWQMTSYTALSALSLSDYPELPTDKADEIYSPIEDSTEALPAGAQTGNIIHELLENISFNELAVKCDISALRDKVCLRYGLKLEKPDVIDQLLYQCVGTPLSADDTHFCLMNIADKQCLKEMPFYLSMSAFNTRKLNEILLHQPTFQTLTYKQLHGFLTGFIDLICEYDNRFYVMDYKTNSLANYESQSLIQAMREHNYGLQYWIYAVVLHRYLQHRLPNYRYQDHFGGVRYLFVRGMQSETPMNGVFEDKPDLSIIESLSALFGN
ncbi:MAG: exodeoxyribonuclease V subunit beta [Methylococcaceae bacterium]|nr:exodeoxyribonuclease V subunit beta [Methylococcaceae bacterium]